MQLSSDRNVRREYDLQVYHVSDHEVTENEFGLFKEQLEHQGLYLPSHWLVATKYHDRIRAEQYLCRASDQSGSSQGGSLGPSSHSIDSAKTTHSTGY